MTTYFLQDGLGSTTGLTDGDGAMTATYQYDVFGALEAQTGEADTGWRFTGELQDPAVGRAPYYLRARYYDPATGRFLSQDPWPSNPMNPQTLNGYLYALDDPARFTDPYGYFPGLPNPGDIKKKAGEISGEVVDTCSSVVGGAADWTRDQAARAGAWLKTCDWEKIGVGAGIVALAAVPVGIGGYTILAAAGMTSAGTVAGAAEGLHLMIPGGIIAVGGGAAIAGVGVYAITESGCGQRQGEVRQGRVGQRVPGYGKE